ncbi:PIN domain-containing protein [Dyadobacter psychrotolerans]|uniref:Type II toxin-antitoxin system VapC family toxin n=1 Tax=Dyadobacter psychrotolerans TaxID=2541721 RepID=A0A4V2Z2B6_9BACT|nr:PIN domain-containing protein [Dyadobacter psychrotolerans]TDE08188.1 type II toxin-antitoxin system VapC family toxin [Dyadobacter psychrotolerans]
MEYFDSDVIFNFLVLQDDDKHHQARTLVLNAMDNNVFTISTLVIQEVGFGLARFGLSNEEIEAKLSFLSSINTIEVNVSHIIRALILAKIIGFKHI